MIVARNIIIHMQFWFAIGGSASRNTVVLRAACLRAGGGVKNAARLAAVVARRLRDRAKVQRKVGLRCTTGAVLVVRFLALGT